MLVDHYGTGQTEALNFQFYEDAQMHAPYPKLRIPTYVLHGRHDETVALQRSTEAQSRFESLIELDVVDDDHSLVQSADRALDAARRFAQGLNLRSAVSPQNADAALKLLKNDPRFD